MNLKKHLMICMCLVFMIFGFSQASKYFIVSGENLSLNNIDNEIVTDEEIKKLKIEYEKLQARKKEELIEAKRIEGVTYLRENVTVISGITEEEMKEVLLKTKGSKTMIHLANAFVDAEKKYGVNAFFMAGIVALESGFATSRRALEDNNLTGYEVYSDSSEGRLFSSHEESVLHTARHLSKNYLKEGAMYYNGLSVDAIQLMYCPDEEEDKKWEYKVDYLASNFLNTYDKLFR
ncbi:MAG TPA: glucosaminidase domain-containing protein [Romboutsia timonensis]|uniref:Glucosaminidase domain-containing protein n=1 Tax=Romboutsia timonensis TaxID=1776391 RepID=A0A921N2N0_9FIRM|nr:glucosaminidase domain-containing protein [uncultured Romboutsia sp.]HJG97205.1 glucosaminidase domain-containing protein [Romboutsia timonensis]